MDTGGLTLSAKEEMEIMVRRQVSGHRRGYGYCFPCGWTPRFNPMDEEIADMLRRQGKPVILTVNKIESAVPNVADFYRLGWVSPCPFPPHTA